MNTLILASKRAFIAGVVLWVLCLLMLGRLPDSADIKPELLQPPEQQQVSQPEFRFEYKNEKIRVAPMATYRIAGLIVSHNDPDKWYRFDITHDEKSLNTRDLCIIWGSNLHENMFKRVSFHNDDWSCTWSYGKDVTHFNDTEISNNHLITANDEIRARINALNVGDQVVMTGRLVSYAEARWNSGQMRQTSMRRDDKGNGACEIILVEDMKVLDSHNWIWAIGREVGYWIAVMAVLVQTAIFLIPRKKKKGRRQMRNGRWDGNIR